jgi:hypothetical protein
VIRRKNSHPSSSRKSPAAFQTAAAQPRLGRARAPASRSKAPARRTRPAVDCSSFNCDTVLTATTGPTSSGSKCSVPADDMFAGTFRLGIKGRKHPRLGLSPDILGRTVRPPRSRSRKAVKRPIRRRGSRPCVGSIRAWQLNPIRSAPRQGCIRLYLQAPAQI